MSIIGQKPRGIWLDGLSNAPNEFDENGIPKWQHHAEHGYHHGCADQTAFALISMMYTFNLPEFDLWLSGLSDCAEKTELLRRRNLALAPLKEGNANSTLRHLEYMKVTMANLKKDDHVLPLAMFGKQAKDQLKKASKKPRLGARSNLLARIKEMMAAERKSGTEFKTLMQRWEKEPINRLILKPDEGVECSYTVTSDEPETESDETRHYTWSTLKTLYSTK